MMTDIFANLPPTNVAALAQLFPNGYRAQRVGTVGVSPGDPGGIPIAENHAAKVPSGTRDTFSASTGQNIMTSELFDTDPANYTKEKALQDIFSQRYSRMQFVNIDGELNLVTPTDFRLIPGADGLETLEQELRESGQADLMWDSFQSVVTKTYCFSSSQNKLSRTVDALAAHYAAQKNILEKRFQGEELSGQLERLDTVWQSAKEQLANEYIEDVNGFLEENGQTGQAEKFRTSVYTALERAAADYEEKIAGEPALLSPADGEDAWLNTHLGYLAASLQMAGRDASAVRNTDGEENQDLFSLSELEIASRTVSRYETAVRDGYTSEHQMAFDLAMLDMETDTAMRLKGAGNPFRKLMEGLRENAVPKVLDRTDAYFANQRASIKHSWSNPSWYPPVDRELFQGIYDAVRGAYRESMDVLDAIRTGASVGRDLTARTAAQGGTAERWEVSLLNGGYWDSFFGAGGRYPGETKSPYQRYTERWQDFLNELGNM